MEGLYPSRRNCNLSTLIGDGRLWWIKLRCLWMGLVVGFGSFRAFFREFVWGTKITLCGPVCATAFLKQECLNWQPEQDIPWWYLKQYPFGMAGQFPLTGFDGPCPEDWPVLAEVNCDLSHNSQWVVPQGKAEGWDCLRKRKFSS